MKIAMGIEMLQLSAIVLGRTNIIYPTLIWDNEKVILVDTGYPGQLAKIREAVNTAGVFFKELNKIIITHHDIDHIGSLPNILNELPVKITVLAHEDEKPHIQGEKGIIKWTAEARAGLSKLPEEQRKAIEAVFDNPPKAAVDKTIADGDELPYCGGITVIHTPGHTPGHICLYHKQSRTLITGDALTLDDGQLMGSKPEVTFDMDLATKSLKKLTQYDIDNVICYHGGLYQDNPNKRIAELAYS